MRYAWDPAWLKAMRSRPRSVLTLGGEPVMAHVAAGDDAAQLFEDEGGLPSVMRSWPPKRAELNYAELRKRERPFVHAARSRRPGAGRTRRL